MLKSLILFQSCLLCQNTEQLRETEKTLQQTPESQECEAEGSVARFFAAQLVEGQEEG